MSDRVQRCLVGVTAVVAAIAGVVGVAALVHARTVPTEEVSVVFDVALIIVWGCAVVVGGICLYSDLKS